MTTPPLVLRFEQILTLLKAWNDDDNREKWGKDKDKPSAVGPVLVSMLEALVTSITEEGARWNKDTRTQMAALFTQRVSSSGGNANWSERNALSRLESQNFKNQNRGRFEQQLELALIEAGCWEDIPARGVSAVKDEEKFSPYGTFMTSVNKAGENNKPEVLERLLDWEGSGARCAPLLLFRETGRSLSADMGNGVATGWAWTVRNVSSQCLDVWLKAGADPNAVDKKGNPVLAYMTTEAGVQQLLAAGADPLGMHLPFEQRDRNFQALWRGWSSTFYHHFRSDPAEHHRFGAAEAYLRKALAQWSEEEVQHTVSAPLYNLYFLLACNKKDNMEQAGSVGFLRALSRTKDYQPLHVERCGLSWSFPGAVAHTKLTLIQPPPNDKTDTIRWEGLAQLTPTDEIAPGVSERDVAALADFQFNVSPDKELLKAVPAKRLPAVLGLLYAQANAHPEANTALLDAVFVVFLAKRNMDTSTYMQAQAPALIDAYLNQLWTRPSTSTFHLSPVLAWMNRYGQGLPLAKRARWAAMALGDCANLKDSTRQLALSTVDEALTSGWNAFADGTDEKLTAAVTHVRQTHTPVDVLFRAKELEHAWEEPKGPKKGGKSPRF